MLSSSRWSAAAIPNCGRCPWSWPGSGGRGVVTSASYEARALRRGRGHAHGPRPAAVPSGPVPGPRPPGVLGGVGGGVRRLRRVHPAGGAGVGGRGLPGHRRPSPHLPVSRGGGPRPAARRCASRPAFRHRWGWPPTSCWPSWPAGPPSPTACASIPAGGEVAFLHPLPVRALWGVGEATHARLEELGVHTVGDLAALPRDFLERRLGPALGGHLSDLARGSGRAAGGGRGPGQVGLGGGDLRGRPRRQAGAGDGVAAARRPPGRPPAGGVGGGAHRLSEGAVRRLHHHQPQPDSPRSGGHRPGPVPRRRGNCWSGPRWAAAGCGSWAWAGRTWRRRWLLGSSAWSRAPGAKWRRRWAGCGSVSVADAVRRARLVGRRAGSSGPLEE